MNLTLLKTGWNLLVVFFLLWSVMAGWFIFCGDDSPVMRLAFALCGCLCLFADANGGLFQSISRCVRCIHEWSYRKRLYAWASGILFLSFPMGGGLEYFSGVRDFYRESHIFHEIKRDGTAILDYAKSDPRKLLPNMRTTAILRGVFEQDTRGTTSTRLYGRPFIRQTALSGVSLSDIREPENVVVLYSRAIEGREGRVAFFADGSAKIIRSQMEFSILLRNQSGLLADASRVKTKREAIKQTHFEDGKP
ncbi:MAG: hypothetical protein H8F28_07985 [Fibrella sp.]|nr:hypothetical protein [Armatimonadota bacterium]